MWRQGLRHTQHTRIFGRTAAIAEDHPPSVRAEVDAVLVQDLGVARLIEQITTISRFMPRHR